MSDPDPAALPEPPYYAVIFASRRRETHAQAGGEDDGYALMAERMVALAAIQPGYLGVESARGADGFGITVSYWADEAAIAAWKADTEHRLAQHFGHTDWYDAFTLRVAKVERQKAWTRPDGGDDES